MGFFLRQLDDSLLGAAAARGSQRLSILFACLLTLFGVAALDYWSGYEASFSVFYLLPIGVASWSGGRAAGLALACVGSILWAWVDRTGGPGYSHWLIPYWNAGVRLLYFALIASLLARIRKLLRREQVAATTDSLTGLLNRTGWSHALEREQLRARRDSSSTALLYLDLDNFKAVNDRQGHATGDRVLQRTAETLRHSVRRTDVLARLGGDEFVVLLPNTNQEAAEAVAAKLHNALREAVRELSSTVGFSFGVATIGPSGSMQDLVRQADQRMYDAKPHSWHNARAPLTAHGNNDA